MSVHGDLIGGDKPNSFGEQELTLNLLQDRRSSPDGEPSLMVDHTMPGKIIRAHR